MKAVILAGGLGTRLRPFTQVIPKPLLPIDGEKTVLEIQISNLKKAGFDEIYIATNYKSELIESYLGNGDRFGVKLFFSKEKKPLGTCGPLSLLKDKLKEPFLMMNGDILTELNFEKLYKTGSNASSPLTVVTKEIIMPFDFGNVIVENNNIIDVKEKPKFRQLIVAGIYMLQPEIFKYIPEDQYFGVDELIKKLLNEKIPINSYYTTDYWVDIGRMDDLNEVIDTYKNKKNEK